jgi:translocation and assembly module TamB
MSKNFRRSAKILAALACLIVLAAGVASTPWVQRHLERWALAKLEAATGARIEIEEFRFRPLILQFIFRGLVLHGKEPPASPPLFSGRTVVIQISPTTLLRRRLSLHSIDWDEATIHIITSSGGSTNLPEPAVAFQTADGVLADFSIGRLSLGRTSIFFNEERLSVNLNAKDVAFLARRIARDKYAGSISSKEINFRNEGVELPPAAMTAHFELSPAGMNLSSFIWQCAGFRGSGRLSLTNWSSPQIALSYQGEGDAKGLAENFKLAGLEAGKLISQGEITYARRELAARGQIQARQLVLQTPAGTLTGLSMSADYSADRVRIRLTHLEGSGLGGSLRGSGEISLRDSPLRFLMQGRVENIDPQRVLDSLNKPRPKSPPVRFGSRGGGIVEASWSGKFRDFHGQYDLAFTAPPSPPATMIPLSGSLRGSVRLVPDLILDVEESNLQSRASRLTGQGTLGSRDTNLALQVTVNNLGEWQPLLESLTGSSEPIALKLNSPAEFRGAISGPLSRPSFRGHLASGPFQYQNSSWDRLTADLNGVPDRLQISSARIEHNGSALNFSGDVPLQDWRIDNSGVFRLSVRADRTRVEAFTSARGKHLPLGGNLSGQLELGGSLADVSGNGHFDIQDGSAYGESVDSFSADIQVARSTWKFADVRLVKGGGTAQGQAALNPWDRTFQAEFRGANFNLSDFQRVADFLTPESKSQLQGKGSFDLHGGGSMDNPTLEASASVQGIVVCGVPAGDLRVRFSRDRDRMRLEGNLSGAGGTLEFAATGPSSPDPTLELAGKYSTLQLQPWVRLLSRGKAGPELTASGTLSGRIPLNNRELSEVEIQAQELRIAYPKLAWTNSGPVRVHYSRGRLTAERFRLSGHLTDLTVEGDIVFGQQGLLSLAVEGSAEAKLLGLLDPSLEASGPSTLQLRVAGSLLRPSITGTIRVQDVTVGYGDLPFRITGLEGEVSLDGDRATLRGLRGTSGGGTVTLGGFVTFGSTQRINMKGDLKQVRIRYPADFTSLLDGTFRLSGTPERSQLSGDLIVRQVFPAENFNWLARAGEWGASPASKGPAVASTVAPSVRLNVQLSSASAVRFEARDLRLVADIDLRLQGTLANPVEVGTIEILSGEAVVRGNRYSLRRGDIRLTNPFRTQPILGIEAQTRIQRYDLTVNVSGPFDRLKIAYRSDPPLPTEDIVSLLAFGYARQQESMSTGTTHPVSTVGASALLSEALSTQVSGRIQRLFGVSRIKIDPNIGGVGTTGGARITVEQQMTRDLTLTYVTNTSSSQQRLIQFEWAATEKVSVLGARDQNGIFAMEFRFRQRFR